MELLLNGTSLREAGSDLLVRESGAPSGALGPLLAVLLVRTAGVPGSAHLPVRQGTVRIGRDSGNGAVLAHPSVSAEHAELRLRGGVWSLADLGSTNGTWVDGEQVLGTTVIAPGSEIRLGEVVVVFNPRDRWEDSVPGASEPRALIDRDAVEAEAGMAPRDESRGGVSAMTGRDSGRVVFGGLDYRDPPARSGMKIVWIIAGVVAIAVVVYLLLRAS